MQKKDNDIKKIYIVMDQDNQVEKSLILFDDEEYDCILRPYNYNTLSKNQQEKVIMRIKRELVRLFKLIPIEERDKKIEFIYSQNLEINNFINDKINKYQEERKTIYNKYNIFGESLYLLSSSICLSANIFHYFDINTLFLLFFGIHSSYFANKSNKSIKGNFLYKKIRLYLSYLLLIGNIGVGLYKFNETYNSEEKIYALNNNAKSFGIYLEQKIRTIGKSNPFRNNQYSSDEEIDILLSSFDKNSMIGENELEAISHFKQFLIDNKYLDYEKLYDEFLTLGIIYDDDFFDYIGAWNNKQSNVISIFKHKDYDHDYVINEILHELVHITGYINNSLICEGFTSLIASEYGIYPYSDGYVRETIMCKILCELIGKDVLLEAYTTNNIELIKDALYDIYPDENFNDEFLKLLDEYGKCEVEEKDEIPNDLVNNISWYLTQYLFGENLNEDSVKNILTYYYVPFRSCTYDDSSIRYYNKSYENENNDIKNKIRK